MDEDDWFARALFDVLQANPLDLNLLGSLGVGYHRLLPVVRCFLTSRAFVACLLGLYHEHCRTICRIYWSFGFLLACDDIVAVKLMPRHVKVKVSQARRFGSRSR
jgi:hypothetical protein